jgi:hypothetical protein
MTKQDIIEFYDFLCGEEGAPKDERRYHQQLSSLAHELWKEGSITEDQLDEINMQLHLHDPAGI